jgi:hypothetical protein
MKFFLFFIGSFYYCLYASDVLGVVEKIGGIVKVKHLHSIKKMRLKLHDSVEKGDIINTYKDGYVVLKLRDASHVIVDKSSMIVFTSWNDFEQKGGKVFYKITTRNATHSLKVKTSFAIIGIKGTTFIVDASNPTVSLKEGLIGIGSIKKEFEIYKQSLEDDFNAFVSAQRTAYEDFKKVQKLNFIKKTKEFNLHKLKSVSFHKNKVIEKSLSKKENDEFKYFEKLMVF